MINYLTANILILPTMPPSPFQHLRRHLKISPYRCGVCGKTVNTYASLQLHQQRMHGMARVPPLLKEKGKEESQAEEDSQGEGGEEALPKVQGRLFHCSLCSKSFVTKGHLKEHVDGVHDHSTVSNCPVCGKAFNTEKRMRKHLFNTHKDVAEGYRKHTKLEEFTDTATWIEVTAVE